MVGDWTGAFLTNKWQLATENHGESLPPGCQTYRPCIKRALQIWRVIVPRRQVKQLGGAHVARSDNLNHTPVYPFTNLLQYSSAILCARTEVVQGVTFDWLLIRVIGVYFFFRFLVEVVLWSRSSKLWFEHLNIKQSDNTVCHGNKSRELDALWCKIVQRVRVIRFSVRPGTAGQREARSATISERCVVKEMRNARFGSDDSLLSVLRLQHGDPGYTCVLRAEINVTRLREVWSFSQEKA